MPPVLLTAQPRSIYFRFFKTCNMHIDCICTYQFQSLVFTVCLMYKFLLVLKLTIASWFLFAFFPLYVALISCITLDVSHQHFFPSWAEIIDNPGKSPVFSGAVRYQACCAAALEASLPHRPGKSTQCQPVLPTWFTPGFARTCPPGAYYIEG